MEKSPHPDPPPSARRKKSESDSRMGTLGDGTGGRAMGGAFGRIARLLRRPTSEPGEPEPDAELLARFARSADQSAFELLVWRHAAMVLGVCRRAVRDHHLAEDAFQATFLVLARKAGSVRGTNVAGWLFGVARRVAARAAARTRARRETPLVAEPVAPAAAECSGELSAVLDEEVGRLPERLRLPVVLCYLGGRSTEDAARVIGCPRGTVLSRLATARRRLAARLTRRGVTVPAALLAVAAVPTGLGAVSGLVPGAVRVSLGQAANSSVAVLAQGVITAMNIGQTVTTAAVFILAGGLTLGLGVFTRTEGQSQPRPAATAPTQKPGDPAARAAAQPAPDRQFVRGQL